MSANEILAELPRLSLRERRQIRRTLADLAEKDEDLELCDRAAEEGAVMLDELETQDGASAAK